ncbi:CotO family spore coat protein [Sediminibacillus albus]|uniref:Spore coat protein CotO n=1 Tax=Sediminibacillus albus TaxID=407036 RepID=A0A1G8X8B9_9BACI|nr:CotO family spore coat protein [Sediminibacillus albus]SDJ86627.1 Spore coat protein CotO [Sediminibacillus albus]
MSRNDKNAREPMLYITQPSLEKPAASMQTNYRTPRKKKRKPADKIPAATKEMRKRHSGKEPEEVSAVDIVEGEIYKELSDDSTTEHSESANKDELKGEREEVQEESPENAVTSQRTKRKRFRDMTITEKVDYFVGIPQTVPRMKCEVTTDNQTYRGVIYDRRNDVVYMKTIKRPFKAEIKQQEIKKIRLLGF